MMLMEVEYMAVVDAAVVVRRDVGVCACGAGRDGSPSWQERIMHFGILDVVHDRLACSRGMMVWEKQ